MHTILTYNMHLTLNYEKLKLKTHIPNNSLAGQSIVYERTSSIHKI